MNIYPRRTSPSRVSSNASQAKQRALRYGCLPVWVKDADLKAVYQQCADQENATGVQLRVRHIVPLKHRRVSGLHVPANLTIVPEGTPEPEQWPGMP